MVALFARFRAIWGERWVRQFGDAQAMELAMSEWGEALSGLSAKQIRLGIDCARDLCEWPPSIAEFVGYAKQEDKLMGAGYCDFVVLPRPVQSPEVVKAALNGMRKALKICR